MTDDVAKAADKLNENMAHAVMNAYKGGINCDIPTATQKALAKRGLATWDWYQGADLTPLGLQVQEYLKAKADAEEHAEMVALAAKLAAERKIREEGYEAGQRQMQLLCLTQLNRAVYGCETWPDRPLDSVWEHLIELVRKHFQPEETA